jgi:dihydroxyacetone kinase-like protein
VTEPAGRPSSAARRRGAAARRRRRERTRDRALARGVTAWLREVAVVVHERREWLTDLDARIGDGDHGINLDRGLQAVVADQDALDPGVGAADRLGAAGRRLLGLVGGASGALYGRGLMTAAERLREALADPARVEDGRSLVEASLSGLVDGVTHLGRASPGDKTMLDALVPALEAVRAAAPGRPLPELLGDAAAAAEAGALATIPLVARKGRASYLGERSAGHEDPGAASSALLLRALADVAARRRPPTGR